jgi:hypothetical protein
VAREGVIGFGYFCRNKSGSAAGPKPGNTRTCQPFQLIKFCARTRWKIFGGTINFNTYKNANEVFNPVVFDTQAWDLLDSLADTSWDELFIANQGVSFYTSYYVHFPEPAPTRSGGAGLSTW